MCSSVRSSNESPYPFSGTSSLSSRRSSTTSLHTAGLGGANAANSVMVSSGGQGEFRVLVKNKTSNPRLQYRRAREQGYTTPPPPHNHNHHYIIQNAHFLTFWLELTGGTDKGTFIVASPRLLTIIIALFSIKILNKTQASDVYIDLFFIFPW